MNLVFRLEARQARNRDYMYGKLRGVHGIGRIAKTVRGHWGKAEPTGRYVDNWWRWNFYPEGFTKYLFGDAREKVWRPRALWQSRFGRRKKAVP